MRQLIFVHGRAQEKKDAATLKKEWIAAWVKGLAKSGLSNPLTDDHIRFPYYGDTLIGLLAGQTPEQVVEIIVKGPPPPSDEEQIMREMISEIAREKGVTEAQIITELSPDVLQKGPANWGWVQGILSVLDKVDPISKALVALVTADVAKYLSNSATSKKIDDGVRSAFLPDTEAVFVTHSLGTVVGYSVMMGRSGPAVTVKVPLFVTLGSPLAVNAVKSRMRPHSFPKPPVTAWFNAMDPDDVVALYPLDNANFATGGAIENITDVDNFTPNQHGIAGYLEDARVAKRIHAALVAP
jgi:hypothetical protein